MIGKVLGDRYEIMEKIGGGGMALVYKARCRLLNRFVAVKVLRPEFTEDEEFVKKFKRESQAAASLSHPNIVGIYDVGMEDNIYYIIMEYVKGQTLKDLLKSKGALGIENATNIALQITAGIEHAHKNHIVHRDIKSHNILIKEDNTVKVTDFGIARAVSSSTITNTGNVIGSVHYFSPEQARGGYTDEKSDFYSLGVVMYEMVTGRLPFEGESPIAVALKHIQEEPIRPTQINPRVPKSIEDIVLKCMEKDVAKRYNTAAEIISDLKQSMVMPNGGFVKKNKVIDENTIIMEPVKATIETTRAEKKEAKQKNKIDADAEGKVLSEPNKTGKEDRSKKLFFAAVIGGLLLALLAFGGIVVINKLFFSVKEVVVPNLINMTQQDAENELKALGLQMVVTESVFNKDVEAGKIIKQDPKENEKNKIINPVKVIVSKGPNTVSVPSIITESYEKVKLVLEKEGLVEGEMTQEYSDYPSGTVIKQSVAPGETVPEGTAINYVVSMGPEKFTMPNYIGQNIDIVRTDLALKDLYTGNITYEFSNDYANNLIINQNVKPGTDVSRKSVIDFVVSKGPEGNQSASFTLEIKLPKDLDNMKVSVQKIQNGKSETIYEKVHSASDSPLAIPISGHGEVVYEVYINGSLFDSKTKVFN